MIYCNMASHSQTKTFFFFFLLFWSSHMGNKGGKGKKKPEGKIDTTAKPAPAQTGKAQRYKILLIGDR